MLLRDRATATPMAFVKAILLAYEKYRVDPGAALAEAAIPPRQLDRPDARITAAQMEALSSAAMRELDDEALGWYSRRLPWGSLGMLCRASLTAPDLGVALKRWCRHHRFLTDDLLLSLNVDGPVATCAIEERLPLGPMREFCLLSNLRYLHGYLCWLIDSRLPLSGVTFPFAAPPHHEVYALLFPGPVLFEAPCASLSFDARYLALALRRDEHALQIMLRRALVLTVRQYRRDQLFVARVRDLLRTGGTTPGTAEALARALHVSTRTLHRHLRNEGLSLQLLKDEVRRDHAVEQLARTRRPVKSIARSVGFRNEKSFARAFRDWTGRTPTEVRRGAPASGPLRQA